jgi:hypothetical protein
MLHWYMIHSVCMLAVECNAVAENTMCKECKPGYVHRLTLEVLKKIYIMCSISSV